MKYKRTDTRYMATLAMLCGILLVMGMTGIGFIPLPYAYVARVGTRKTQQFKMFFQK